MSQRILIVGAGFAGAVHARELAEAGFAVDVIDRRPHIAGNAYDEIAPTGLRVHRYGPHLFHTNNAQVVDWLARFCAFLPYEHRVEARLANGAHVPLPINRDTVNAVFGVNLRTPGEVERFLASQAVPHASPLNAAQFLESQIGRPLTDLFFRPYNKKMWALDLEDISPDIVKRIPVRFDDEARYFPGDRFQGLPRGGYTRLFESIFDHPHIAVLTGVEFHHGMLREYRHCFNSMAIDEFFEERLGPLPYRSIRFHHREQPSAPARGTAAQINFTDDGPFSREIIWDRLPGHRVAPGGSTVTHEEPCDYRDNGNERYYPVKRSDGAEDRTYRQYLTLAGAIGNVTFIGRCGTYQYLDMHQVINQSLNGVRTWIRNERRW